MYSYIRGVGIKQASDNRGNIIYGCKIKMYVLPHPLRRVRVLRNPFSSAKFYDNYFTRFQKYHMLFFAKGYITFIKLFFFCFL